MIKIAPHGGGSEMKLGLPETSEDVPLRNAEPSEDNKSESSKLRLKIKK